MKRKYEILSIIIIMLLTFQSCSIETYSTRKSIANETILKYLFDNDLDIEPNSSGIVFIKIKEGVGECPKDGDKVAFHYTGSYLDGEVFETSNDKPYPLIVELGNGMIIKGLEESLKMMNKGAKAKVIIPFYLAYNDMENAPVPPYSNLVFELELIDFTTVKQ